jgi:hypothetical protein
MPADPRLHATHDAELVAAYAAGDATGADLAAAGGLVAGCAECAALHRDLRAIMAALPAMPVPVRPRDFRLTPEQAAAIRPPSGLRRLLAPLAGARFAFAGPAGAGLAALGLAGILLSGRLNVQPPAATAGKSLTSTTPQAAAGAGAGTATSAGPGLAYGPVDQAVASPAASVAQTQASEAPATAPSPVASIAGPCCSAAPSTAPSMATTAPSPAPSAITPSIALGLRPLPYATTSAADNGTGTTTNQSATGGGATTPPAAPLPSTDAAAPLDVASPSTSPVTGLALALVIAGLLLAGARWTARRFG